MFSMGATSTRSALIIENTKPDGSKETLIYDLRVLSMSMEHNIFGDNRVTIDGYIEEGRLYTNPASPFDFEPEPAKEIESPQLAITNNEEIVEGEIIEDD